MDHLEATLPWNWGRHGLWPDVGLSEKLRHQSWEDWGCWEAMPRKSHESNGREEEIWPGGSLRGTLPKRVTWKGGRPDVW